MFNRQDLPKLYHLDNDNPINKTKSDDKRARKTVSTSKLISTNETNDSEILLTDQQTDKDSIHQTMAKQTDKLTNETVTDLQADECLSDLDEEECETDSINNLIKDDLKVEIKDNSKDDLFDNLQKDQQQAKKSIELNIDSLKEVINELKANKSRVAKISVEKCFQRKNGNLSKNEITDYINKCLDDEILEKVKYRDYYGIRLKASFKNSKRSVNDEQELIDTTEESDKLSLNDKSSINDQDTMSNLDNLSECSSNINALNEDLDDEIDNLGYNTKKNALKRCSPTIRYLLRTAPEIGISPADMLKTLQSKRILILYDLKKFIWLMKTYFVEKGICEQLTNGNYKYNMNNEEENSNASAIKSQNNEATLNLAALNCPKLVNDEEIDLLADEKFSDNENSELSEASGDEQQSKEEIISEFNSLSTQLSISKLNETSNTSVQSASNLDYLETEMIPSSPAENRLNLKRKIKPKIDKLSSKALDSTLRRPISQRKKIKKSLGPDFLDPSGVKYQLLKSSYENKCEMCFKNSDKTMVDCKKCKFKAHRQCLSDIDLMFERNLKKFECMSCRIKCCFCKLETEALINNIITCKKCSISYHINCLLNKTDVIKYVKNCTTCEKTYFKYLMDKRRPQSKVSNQKEISSTDKQEQSSNNLDIELNEASNSSHLKTELTQEEELLEQSKDVEMTENNDISEEKNTKSIDSNKEIESTQLNRDEINEDSNHSNAAVSSSTNSSNSNLENSKRVQEDENIVQKYRKLFKAYDVHQQVEISKEQFNTLKSLNSYSNGKSPFDWTVDDVADFISSIGFPEESSAFKKEEIDGQSLLLLKRKDVLTGLSMRLGTALKVYSYIYKLQASV